MWVWCLGKGIQRMLFKCVRGINEMNRSYIHIYKTDIRSKKATINPQHLFSKLREFLLLLRTLMVC